MTFTGKLFDKTLFRWKWSGFSCLWNMNYAITRHFCHVWLIATWKLPSAVRARLQWMCCALRYTVWPPAPGFLELVSVFLTSSLFGILRCLSFSGLLLRPTSGKMIFFFFLRAAFVDLLVQMCVSVCWEEPTALSKGIWTFWASAKLVVTNLGHRLR